MSGAIATESEDAATSAVRATTLVDCDVHPLIGDVADLRPFMSSRAARRVFGQEVRVYARDPNRIPHPTSGLRLDARTPSGGAPGSDPAFALEQWIDPYDIAAAILIPVQAGIVIPWGDEGAGVEFLGAMNRYFLERWTGLDPRFRTTLSISPYNVPAAVAEIERHADTPGVAGIFIPAAGVGLGRSHYHPIYEAAEHYGLPIVLHPTGAEANLAEAPRVAGGLPDTYPERHSMLLQPGQAILASMIFGAIFERFPSLTLVLSEYGTTWAAPLAWRMDNAWEQGDRSLAGLPMPPSHYVNRNVRFTTQPLDEPPEAAMLHEFLELLDAGRTLMFSSDYPHWDTDEPRYILNSRLPAALRRRIAAETARECFGDRLGIVDG
jgi:uncharacterized protein